MSGRVGVHLRIRVSQEKRAAFDAFLREAIPFYEAPGGIRVRLVEEEGDPTRLIEIVEYASEMKYLADRERVTNDTEMAGYLERWRALLDGPPVVEVYYERGPGARPTVGHVTGGEEVRTERLVLRPFSGRDAGAVMTLAGDRRVAATTLTVPHPYGLHDAIGWIESHEGHRLAGTAAVMAVCEAGGPLVGAIGLQITRAHDRAELGYWFGVPFWGKGYATEASIGMIRYAFGTLNLNRINASHFGSNPASGRVLEKAGLKREGCLPKHVKRFGEYQDSVLYGIGRDEWTAARR
ncbi:MAG TPA: GNAT family N-acetyltransferase [Phycisphaerales bacterium]|nr:GNAT family N-acetyltransferase [Phycisphaerales bacterium]